MASYRKGIHSSRTSALLRVRTPKLSDGGHEARRLQPRRPAAVRCSDGMGSSRFFRGMIAASCG